VWRRPPPDLDLLLGCRYQRVVARDNTVRVGPRLVVIPPGPGRRSFARCRVEVRELLDGRVVVFYADQIIAGKRRRPPTSSSRLVAPPTATAAASPRGGVPHGVSAPPSPSSQPVPRRPGLGSIPGGSRFPARPRFANRALLGDDIFMLQYPRHFH
jgi:hypothetical protein